jgi:signal transduction histidine kinase
MVSFVVIVLVLNSLLINRMTSQVDQRLHQRMILVGAFIQRNPSGNISSITPGDGDRDNDDVPILVWRVRADGSATALSSNTPSLPRQQWSEGYRTFSIATSNFRFEAVPFTSGWLVDAESLANVRRLRNTLGLAEFIAGLVLLILMFGAAFVVGIRALAPVALAKRRQSEFVADASHELRTPLSVIEAEVDLALSRDRDSAAYRATLDRVKSESTRLKKIVEDLLWLARSDEKQREVTSLETVDLASITAQNCSRFQTLAASHDVSLVLLSSVDIGAMIEASDELIDRLLGVLIDNAIKFAGAQGRVEVSVFTHAKEITLRVDDSGSGVTLEDQSKVFERFHHSNSPLGGTGLGLAIAASIAQRTSASFDVSSAELGGARFEFTWHVKENENKN